MSTEVVKAETFGIEESKANKMISGLDTILAEREILKEAYLDVMELEINPETIGVFKELRLKVVKNRTQGIEKWRKSTKAFYLAGGRFVDAKGNMESSINEDWESKLLAAEKTYENIEKERIEALKVQRMIQMEAFDIVTNDANVELMTDDVFKNYINGVKLNFEHKKAEEEKAEQERIDKENKEAAEREAQRVENVRLKTEAAAREKEIIAEQKERDRLSKIETDKQAKIKAESDVKLKKENEAREKAELEAKKAREESERLTKAAADYKAKIKEDEAKRLKAEQDAKKAADQAPDKEKLKAAIDSVKMPNVTVKDKGVQDVHLEIAARLNGWIKWANDQVNNLK